MAGAAATCRGLASTDQRSGLGWGDLVTGRGSVRHAMPSTGQCGTQRHMHSWRCHPGTYAPLASNVALSLRRLTHRLLVLKNLCLKGREGGSGCRCKAGKTKALGWHAGGQSCF